ncbi:hypothetical protein [Gelidibacter gilvus]|uniref:Lipocalin-like domain-containing protein n=1 Tax=Gelidibacter gilvus TaxID=59602 RepID=A0A4V1LMY5_9FLAO|nr:hypothetical protein [Gelidibacter gilvus]RXJ50122.1 hypothetical protein ESZ48_09035 [Gelidibacter gilvus]
MKTSLRLLFLTVSFVILVSISKDDVKNPVIGGWQLTTWTVGIPIDLKASKHVTTNLLDQTSCTVNETLSFDKDGIVISEDSFSPKITIRLKDGSSDVYIVEEVCAEGVIGFATDYSQETNGEVQFNGTIGIVSNNRLTVVYKEAIKIYNEALTEVIESKDLTLVYTKKG